MFYFYEKFNCERDVFAIGYDGVAPSFFHDFTGIV